MPDSLTHEARSVAGPGAAWVVFICVKVFTFVKYMRAVRRLDALRFYKVALRNLRLLPQQAQREYYKDWLRRVIHDFWQHVAC